MKSLFQTMILPLVIIGLTFYSCKKDKSCEDCATNQSATPTANTNKAPIASAGNDTSITLPVNTANLDGSRSTDPDNNITNYRWTKISGPSSFTITNTNTSQTQVTNLVEGSYWFELKVTDDGGLIARDTVQVTVLVSMINPGVSGVYIAGLDTGNNAAQWINDTVRVLTEVKGTTAFSVFLGGSDVYVAGGAFNHWFGFDTTFIWKNGIAQNFDKGELEGVTSVFVSGNDVYAAGWGEYGARLWKNGQVTNLGNDGANAVVVSGSDVYVAGWERKDINQGNNTWTQTLIAKYWKNGVAQTLGTGGSGISVAYSVFAFNGDVYVAGHVGWISTLWKNGVAQNLGNGEAKSVYVFNGDVYVAGTSNGNATLWKNGVAQNLGNGEAKSVYVFNGDVYVAGYEERNSNGTYTRSARLWKNGVAYTIEGLSEANSVFVK